MNEERPRIGPKAAEDEAPQARPAIASRQGALRRGPSQRGLSLRAVLPNAITAAALCSGLTGVRFAIGEQWELAIFAIVIAGLLDGIDGRIARLLKAQSRFGAELDSLADSLSFGAAPALIAYLWTLQDLPRLGWFAALAFAICCALRLARFNAQIDVDEQPHKSAGFLTGIPAPMAAGLAFLPFYLWMATGLELFRTPWIMALWMGAVAVLMISNLATLSWKSLRPRRSVRLELIALVGMVFAGMLLEPWWTFTGLALLYVLTLPYGMARYARIRRQRAAAPEPAGQG